MPSSSRWPAGRCRKSSARSASGSAPPRRSELRIIFALVVSYLLNVPFLKVAGGVLLFWIAVKLAMGEEEAHNEIEASDSLWKAVRTIAIADAVMSLDNVIAIAAASRGHPELFIFGLLLSIPLIIMGAQFLTTVIERYPILVWLGAALLGWIAAEMIVGDAFVLNWLQGNLKSWVVPVSPDVNPLGLSPAPLPHYVTSTLGAIFVVALAYVLKRRRSVERVASELRIALFKQGR